MRGPRPIIVLLALASLQHVVTSLRIAAFNIRSFGETKMSNATLSSYIVQILSRYDIALVQEVRDTYLTAVGKLLDELNRDAPDNYHYVVSEPLGRSSYKEQYLFVYRPDQVSVLDSYYYDDGCEPCGNDTFSREPAIVKFFSPYTHVREFAIVPLHAAPADAVTEIDALYDVYLDVRQKWGLELCDPLPVVLHPSAYRPCLPVAHSRHCGHHSHIHTLCLRQDCGLWSSPPSCHCSRLRCPL
ncbi:deoxyribonuclease-1 isoform X4 [Marmota marmota marmota]|uniref:deoxyribonuclease-1 isoform X4 n=1 Tax=Marmota marmota marmota TaxID=9994 RepID=UPI002093C78D|nr:deoxyribonuclease-1 isoform X4 [Marmota marmota marmota]